MVEMTKNLPLSESFSMSCDVSKDNSYLEINLNFATLRKILWKVLFIIFFIFILSQAVFRGIDVHCGCFKSVADSGVTDLRFELIKRIIEDFILFKKEQDKSLLKDYKNKFELD